MVGATAEVPGYRRTPAPQGAAQSGTGGGTAEDVTGELQSETVSHGSRPALGPGLPVSEDSVRRFGTSRGYPFFHDHLAGTSNGFPLQIDLDTPDHIARWRPLVHWLLVIQAIVLYALRVQSIIRILTFFAILFTGKIRTASSASWR